MSTVYELLPDELELLVGLVVRRKDVDARPSHFPALVVAYQMLRNSPAVRDHTNFLLVVKLLAASMPCPALEMLVVDKEAVHCSAARLVHFFRMNLRRVRTHSKTKKCNKPE
jgi:hypothetical protein